MRSSSVFIALFDIIVKYPCDYVKGWGSSNPELIRVMGLAKLSQLMRVKGTTNEKRDLLECRIITMGHIKGCAPSLLILTPTSF